MFLSRAYRVARICFLFHVIGLLVSYGQISWYNPWGTTKRRLTFRLWWDVLESSVDLRPSRLHNACSIYFTPKLHCKVCNAPGEDLISISLSVDWLYRHDECLTLSSNFNPGNPPNLTERAPNQSNSSPLSLVNHNCNTPMRAIVKVTDTACSMNTTRTLALTNPCQETSAYPVCDSTQRDPPVRSSQLSTCAFSTLCSPSQESSCTPTALYSSPRSTAATISLHFELISSRTTFYWRLPFYNKSNEIPCAAISTY